MKRYPAIALLEDFVELSNAGDAPFLGFAPHLLLLADALHQHSPALHWAPAPGPCTSSLWQRPAPLSTSWVDDLMEITNQLISHVPSYPLSSNLATDLAAWPPLPAQLPSIRVAVVQALPLANDSITRWLGGPRGAQVIDLWQAAKDAVLHNTLRPDPLLWPSLLLDGGATCQLLRLLCWNHEMTSLYVLRSILSGMGSLAALVLLLRTTVMDCTDDVCEPRKLLLLDKGYPMSRGQGQGGDLQVECQQYLEAVRSGREAGLMRQAAKSGQVLVHSAHWLASQWCVPPHGMGLMQAEIQALRGRLKAAVVAGWMPTNAEVLLSKALEEKAFDDVTAEDAVIPNLADRNLYLQLCRGMPPPGENSRPSAATYAIRACCGSGSGGTSGSNSDNFLTHFCTDEAAD
ncbi:hypothetical protein HaLaN_19332, partial [Haematococcus lacustris]